MFSLLSACGQKTIFSGETVNWSVKLEFTQMGESVETTGSIKYIGPEPAPDTIEYSIDGDWWSGNGPLPKNKIFNIGKSGCRSNCSLPSKDSEFKAIIKWNDDSEIVTLTEE